MDIIYHESFIYLLGCLFAFILVIMDIFGSKYSKINEHLGHKIEVQIITSIILVIFSWMSIGAFAYSYFLQLADNDI